VVALQDVSAIDSAIVHPLGEAATLGPWTITVLEVVSGEEAASLLLQVNSENPPAPEGQVFLCVRIGVRNIGDVSRAIQMVDFAATGGDGVLRRTQAIMMPDPMLQSVVEPGASTEGWIAVTVDDPSVATLWFDSSLLGGSWADGFFALVDGATLPAFDAVAANDTDAGVDPRAPAAIGETVTVDGWEIAIAQVLYGTDIFDIADFRYQALGPTNSWVVGAVAVHASVRNLNPFPAFFSDITFELADFSGEAWDHTPTMTGPEPDVSQEYLPGASGEGWATFGGLSYNEPQLIKVQPFKVGGGARYVIFDGLQPVASDADAADESPAEPLDLATGDVVETTEDLVNLRSEASIGSTIIEELVLGTQLEISGDAVDADGYTWRLVIVTDTANEGYVVQDFLAPIED